MHSVRGDVQVAKQKIRSKISYKARNMKKGEVVKYIESIKDPQKFLEYCKKFHEREPRDIAYVVSRYVISKDQFNVSFILASAKLIIITWNAAKFRKERGLRVNLENDILEAYKASKDGLEKLYGKRLELLNLEDTRLREDIKNIFLEFSSKKSIGFTGASKILHILNPHVFMIWDNGIRKAYHKLHDKNHTAGDEECYLEFLKNSQEIIKAILSKSSEDVLWDQHLTFVDKQFMATFSFRESILKMLDECNYVRLIFKI